MVSELLRLDDAVAVVPREAGQVRVQHGANHVGHVLVLRRCSHAVDVERGHCIDHWR